MGDIENHRIFRIEGAPSTYQNGQIGFDSSADSDLGFVMFCGKDHNGDTMKMLAKDELARVSGLTILDDDFQMLFENSGNIGVITMTNTVTNLGQMKFVDDLLDSGGIVARFADSAAEAAAFLSDFGDVSLMAAASWLYDNLGSGVTLQDAYETSAGSGISLTDALGPFKVTGDATDTTDIMALTSLNTSTGGDIINLYNEDAGANAIYFNGGAGDGNESLGHLLFADGSISVIGDFSTEGRAFFNAQKYTGEGTSVYGILRAEDDGASDYGEVRVSKGDVTLTSTDDIFLDSASVINIDAVSYLTFSDTSVRDFKNISYSTLTYVSLSSGVADINWTTGTNIQRVNLNANCTGVTMTNAPPGPAELILIFENNSTIHTVTGFSSTTWFGDYDLDTTPYSVPANEKLWVRLIFDGSVYLAQAIGEV